MSFFYISVDEKHPVYLENLLKCKICLILQPSCLHLSCLYSSMIPLEFIQHFVGTSYHLLPVFTQISVLLPFCIFPFIALFQLFFHFPSPLINRRIISSPSLLLSVYHLFTLPLFVSMSPPVPSYIVSRILLLPPFPSFPPSYLLACPSFALSFLISQCFI